MPAFLDRLVTQGRRPACAWLAVALVVLSPACGKEASNEPAPTGSGRESLSPAPKVTPPPPSQPPSPNVVSPNDLPPPTPTAVPLLLTSGQGATSRTGAFRAAITRWVSGPSVTLGEDGRNAFEITLARADGTAPASVTVGEVFPYMKVHGHGSPRAYQPALAVEGSVVKVTRLGFVMEGPWEVVVRATIDGREDTVEIPVEVAK